jgi:hypothetical protein
MRSDPLRAIRDPAVRNGCIDRDRRMLERQHRGRSCQLGTTWLKAAGLGAYTATATDAGDYPRVVLGIVVMSVMVVTCNRLIWRPLYRLAERRFRLD